MRENVRNPAFVVQCFGSRRESAAWVIAECRYCPWEWPYTANVNLWALRLRLALHLVECHVDIDELLMSDA